MIELTVVLMRFSAAEPEALLGVLSKYVVMARGAPGCRNIDLVASVTSPGRLVVIQKWDSPEAQRAHFDSPTMVDMAESCRGLLTEPPDIDLLEAISAHDLA
jgi:quinol monooxygenase YgiN